MEFRESTQYSQEINLSRHIKIDEIRFTPLVKMIRSGSQSCHLNPYFFFFSYCNHPSEFTTMMECLWMLQLLLQSPHNRSRLDRVAFFFTQPRVLCLSLSTLLNRHATAQTRLASSSGTCNVEKKNTSEFYNHLCFSLLVTPLHCTHNGHHSFSFNSDLMMNQEHLL